MCAAERVGPYAVAALHYLDLGWSPLPLPAGAKSPPPEGFTGYAGSYPDEAQVRRWVIERARRAEPAEPGPDAGERAS